MKPIKCPANEKKWDKKSEKKESSESEILLSEYAWTLQANILYLEQKAALKCLTVPCGISLASDPHPLGISNSLHGGVWVFSGTTNYGRVHWS